MKLTVDHLKAITGTSSYKERKSSLCDFMNTTAATSTDIMAPHRLAAFLAEVLHESGNLKYVKENLNYSASGLRKVFRKYFKTTALANKYARKPKAIASRVYANRMGNGNEASKDGWKYAGRDIIQITGHDNYAALTKWIRAADPTAPDFVLHPDELAKPKWLGLGALWYWSARVPKKYVDSGNREMIRRRINGGLNGYSDTLKKYDRCALVLLGFKPDGIHAFQMKRPELTNDGVSGPATRAALHKALVAAGDVSRETSARPKPKPINVTSALRQNTAPRRSWWSRLFGRK